jgi:hypothetical protein
MADVGVEGASPAARHGHHQLATGRHELRGMHQQQSRIVQVLQHVRAQRVRGAKLQRIVRRRGGQQIALNEARGRYPASRHLYRGAAQFQAQELRSWRQPQEFFGELTATAADLQHAYGAVEPANVEQSDREPAAVASARG